MSLDPVTGLDPKGIKLRAANGLEAVDYFMPGYHVWAKLVEALADMGYDANTLVRTLSCCFLCFMFLVLFVGWTP